MREKRKRVFRKVKSEPGHEPFRSSSVKKRPLRRNRYDEEAKDFKWTKKKRGEQFEKSETRHSKFKTEKPYGKPVRSSRSNRFSSSKTGKHPASPVRLNKFNKEEQSKTFEPARSKQKPVAPESSAAIRLNRYISNAGICSRREADKLIAAGLVSVNGETVTQMGTKVSPGDVVKYNNETLKRERNVYVLLNKPKDFITTSDDPDNRRTVMQLVKEACCERLYPVGRLDRNTTGLLLMTNDGELTRKLTHPSSNISKIYHVELDRKISPVDMDKIAGGIELEDGIANVDEIAYDHPTDKSQVGIRLHSGRNRVVRRIFEALGYEVRKLDRVIFAGLTKKDLPRGHWRFLTDKEVSFLKMAVGRSKPADQSK